MRRTKFIVPVLYAISMVIFAAQAAGAEIETNAKKKKKPPNTVKICGTMPGPGWITVSVDGICGGQGNRQLIGRTIIQYDELPSGSELGICGDPVPAQWVSAKVDNAPCAQIGGTFYIKRTIVRIDGMAPGTSIKSCGAQQTPSGWAPTSVSSKPCATVLNGFYIGKVLMKIEGLPPDSVVKTCGMTTIPPGWLPTKVDKPYCGSFQGTNYIGKTIRNIESLPPGTTISTCSGMPPEGWVTSAVSKSYCGQHGNTSYIERKITKVDGLPAGATLRMCGGSVPMQWIATAIPGYCASLGNSHFLEHTIKHIEGLPMGTVLDQCGGTTPYGWSVKNTKPGYCAKFGSVAYRGRTIVKTAYGLGIETTAAADDDIAQPVDFDADDDADDRKGRERVIDPEAGTIPIGSLPVVPLSVAEEVAKRYVTARAVSEERPEWQDATIGEPQMFREASELPIAYEFPVTVAGEPRGAIVTGATEGTSAVIMYWTEGPPMHRLLQDALAERIGASVDPERVRFYYGGASRFGIAYETDAYVSLDPDDASIGREGATIFYAPGSVVRTRSDWQEAFAADFRVTPEWLEQERMNRRDDDGADRLHADAKQPPADEKGVPGGSASFAPFYQENRKWPGSSVSCYAGCSPVAAAILLEFWDRRGYKYVIGSDSSNRKHYAPGESDVRDAIGALRTAMKTSCSGKNSSGSTSASKIPSGISSYLRDRGYKWRIDNESILRWLSMIDEIKSGRPVLLSFYLKNKNGHTAVAYSYRDDKGTKNDTFCVMTGWESPRTACYNVYSSTETWGALTRVRP